VNRSLAWEFEEGPGLELLDLHESTEIVAESTVIGRNDGPAFAMRYRLEMDGNWVVRELRAEVFGSAGRVLELRADGAGSWTTPAGDRIPDLDGCIDVDLTATPFTNTLPVRRLRLEPGQAETLAVAFITCPALTYTGATQRYTCLERGADRMRYRYESLRDGVTTYENELELDRDGIVLDYPGYARRVIG
jgi:hypothetical protein